MAKLLLTLLLMSIERASCYFTFTALAKTSSGYVHMSYSNNDSFTVLIKPSAGYSSNDYYLEIKWDFFDVKGDMPDCNGDYLDIYLTRSKNSIGKFCSSNLVSSGLFTMYSSDGYAKMVFKADGSNTGNGFKFFHRLRSKSSNYLGDYTSTSCNSVPYKSKSGVLYSEGWPKAYATSSSSCTQKVYVGSSYHARVSFMDVDLNKGSYSCGSFFADYVQLHGAKSISDYSESSKEMCSSSSVYTVQHYKYFFIEFNRYIGSQSSHRGFVAGYVVYNPGKSTPANEDTVRSSSSVSAVFLSIVIGAVVIFIVILGVIIYKCKRRSNNRVIERPNQEPTAVPMTCDTTTTGAPSTVIVGPSTVAYGAPNANQQHPGSYANPAVVSSQGYAAPYPAATNPIKAAPPPYAHDMGNAQ